LPAFLLEDDVGEPHRVADPTVLPEDLPGGDGGITVDGET